jgi:acetyltransferase-like isoleucine patch superfamily enzyme
MSLLSTLFTRSRKYRIRELRNKYPGYAIGRASYGSPEIVTWGNDGSLRIGSFCSFAPGVKLLLGGEHRMDWVTTYPFNVVLESASGIEGHPHSKGDIVIGNDVWIGAEAVILSGVTIGDGAVIGARAVVTGDIEPYAIHAGNPARFVRKRFDDALIEQLLDLQWWHFPDEKIERLMPFLLDSDIQRFIDEARK